MEFLQRVRKTDLARNTRQVLRQVQRGQTVIVEGHGQPEAAILDIVDYQLQRAAIYYFTHRETIAPRLQQAHAAGLPDSDLTGLEDEQERYNLVIACYLAEAISLGRTAELLKLPWVDLRSRFARLGIPLRVGPVTAEELQQDIENAQAWAQRNRS
jgi:predicted HTH domain antitoxin/antitoxin (DNA-binding transcriptional repressor) of toxin-antitoxin stability system